MKKNKGVLPKPTKKLPEVRVCCNGEWDGDDNRMSNLDICLSIKKRIAREGKALLKKQQEIADSIAELKSVCEHSQTSNKESYTDGSYYDTGSITRWTECDICGAKSESETKSDGQYG